MNPTKDSASVPEAETEELTKYELMTIFVPDLSQEELDKELEKIRKEIKKLKGEIFHEDNWDIRDLAYQIKKFDKGYYFIFYFTIDPASIKELEQDFRINNKIIRYLIVRSPKNYVIKKLEDFLVPVEERKPDSRPQRPGRPGRAPFSTSKPRPIEEKPVKKAEKVEKAEEPVKEEKPKETPKPKAVESKPMVDISDLDSKLESILDDPDIDIKL